MKGEAQLINLMHCRYFEGLRDMVIMIGGDEETIKRNVRLANKLSRLNVDNYQKDWGKRPSPMKKLSFSDLGNIETTQETTE